jgi:hypothetical protein
MSVRLCLVSVHWPAPPIGASCYYDEISTEQESYKTSFRHFRPIERAFSEEALSQIQTTLEADPDDGKFVWKERALFTLARDESLFSVDFIPRDPTKDTIVHLHRIRDEEESLDQTYIHNHGGCKFFLPVQDYPDSANIFDLFSSDIFRIVNQLLINPLQVTTALIYLRQDPDTLGVALTTKKGTFMWIKAGYL